MFKQVWQDPLAQKNGRRGQAQHGVDIFSSSIGVSNNHFGVQCKGKDNNYNSKTNWSEVLTEVAKAENFSPKLDHWIFAATSPTDGNLQKAARELSIEHKTKGLFSVTVLGWEEIQALMSEAPQVIAEFYPEQAEHLPQVIEALKALPTLQATLASIAEKIDEKRSDSLNPHGSAVWENVTFNEGRGLGPALMGYPLGPSDAASCPRLNEVNAVIKNLKVAYSARIIGEPGTGKSICSYQTAKEFASEGYEVLRLVDPQSDNVALERELEAKKLLYLIDDAHLLNPHLLGRIEQQSNPNCLILSTHNAIERVNHRGAITLDAKRAVKTIATELRATMAKTLEAVRLVDDDVGDRMMDADLGKRLDHAEDVADRPWQFCFVLGGGWRRSKQAADSARAANTDLVLSAIAIRQIISRDARAIPAEIIEVCLPAQVETQMVNEGLEWLKNQRLIIGETDCRTPHQRFASVVLRRVLEGQNEHGRKRIAKIIGGVMGDSKFPYAGLRILVHELRFGSGGNNWMHLLNRSEVDKVIARCWAAKGTDRGFAALTLSDLWDIGEGGLAGVVKPYVATLSDWFSNPSDGAYGFGHMFNNLVQQNKEIAVEVVTATNPVAVATAYSNANPDTAYGLAELACIASAKVEVFNDKFRTSLDRSKLHDFAKDKAFSNDAFIFAKFCASVLWWDKNLALELAEQFIPTAQQLLARDPIHGFNQLTHDFASTVLRVFDPLGVYVGKFKPTPRQRGIARQICKTIDPKQVAEEISQISPRNFQPAAFFLKFLCDSSPQKYYSILRQIDWKRLDEAIGNDWENMPHETEVLLGTLSSHPGTRPFVQKLISDRADQIVQFPPRLMLLAQDVGLAHMAKGGTLRLAQFDHVSWDIGGFALAILANASPELVEAAVAPFIETIAKCVTNYNRDSTGPAEGFVRVVTEYAPIAWSQILIKIDPITAQTNLAECLTMDEDHRRTAACVIESALVVPGSIGEISRNLRLRFPKTSIPSTDDAIFFKRHRRSRSRSRKRVS